MANITYLEMVNRVLRRLRERQVSSLSGASDYVSLIAALVNEAKEEVEAAWQWNSQNTSLDISVVSGTSTYSLTGFGDEFSIQLVFDTTNNYFLKGPITAAEITYKSQLVADTSSSSYLWSIFGRDSNGDPQIKFYPTPDENVTINVLARVKDAYLTSDADEITVPWRPVYLCALAKAISERGEDGGLNWDEINMSYEKALGDAISYDATLGHVKKDWTPE